MSDRPLTPGERAYVATDRLVVIGVQLEGPEQSEAESLRHLRSACSRLLLRHPALCHKFDGAESEGTLCWRRLEAVDLVRTVLAGPSVRTDAELLEVVQAEHRRAFDTPGGALPLWRLVVVRDARDGRQGVTLPLLCFHHAALDGRSALVFHEQLVDALNRGDAADGAVTLGAAPTCTAALHPPFDRIFDAAQLGDATKPAEPAPAFSGMGYTRLWALGDPTQLCTATLEPTETAELVRACREAGVGVTAALLAAAGAAIVETFSGRGHPPSALLPTAAVSYHGHATPTIGRDELVALAASATPFVPHWRVEPEPVVLDAAAVWEEARVFSAALRDPEMVKVSARTFALPLQSLTITAEERVRRVIVGAGPAAQTYEVSNIVASPARSQGPWSTGEDGIFSQPNGPATQFLDFSTITVRGRLRVTLSSLDARVEPSDAEATLKRAFVWLRRMIAAPASGRTLRSSSRGL